MKNKFKIFLILISFCLFNSAYSANEFNFDVTEIEILENGNIFKGKKRGTVTTNDGIILKANEFEYNKNLNTLNAKGNVEIIDKINNFFLSSNQIIYNKNKELIISTGDSKALSSNNDIVITAEIFEYELIQNKITAKNNVVVTDKVSNNRLYSNLITYYKNEDEFVTKGRTRALIESKYDFRSKDVTFSKKLNLLSSKKDTTIFDDNSQLYNLSSFKYFINKKELRAEDIIITTNYNLPKSDKFYFSSAIINLKQNDYIASDTKIEMHKSIFANKENDPRLLGISSKSDGVKTTLNKAIFTSCKKNDDCPPWSISADTIEHDKEKKQITYNSAILRIYNKPVIYFPKFFHPDPTVERQSGLLKPSINNSNVLGSSFTLPYFSELSENKDFTIKPTWFDSGILMLQNEYRQIKNQTEFLIDFGYVNGFESSSTNKKKNINHIFFNLNHNLELNEFNNSEISLSIEKTNNDTYLKLFEPHITNSKVRPNNFNTLKNHFELVLNNDQYNFDTGIISYEDLQIAEKNDRYQYILPYYNFDKILSDNFFNGFLNFSSSGNNNLDDTNQLKSNIINDLSYKSENFISNLGISNNILIDIKNLNSLGKNYSEYKSSPQVEVMGTLSLNSSLPLQKIEENYRSFLTPKASFKFNPTDMKNYSTSQKKIDVGNIFNLNRLGLSDTLEAGRSITLGIDYKKEIINQNKELNNINKYFELKLATVLRDKEEDFIPKSSTLNRKTSNLFGSIDNQLFENLNIKYNFALDNNYKKLEYNDLTTTLRFGDFETTLNFIEENGEMGNSSIMENSFVYAIDESNSVKFNTRRNRKLNLTEYYDLIYEYKNDCLTAGIEYKKTYYEDRDLKPSENLLFTITLFPLTTYEYSADQLVKN